jgi:hypothetical protein
MDEERPTRTPAPLCRWRTSAETLDMIEALERIEALLLRLDARMRPQDAGQAPADELKAGVRDVSGAS